MFSVSFILYKYFNLNLLYRFYKIIVKHTFKTVKVHKLRLDGTLERYIGAYETGHSKSKNEKVTKNEDNNEHYSDDDEDDDNGDDDEGFNILTNKNISALTVSQNGSLLLADVSGKKIYVLLPNTPGSYSFICLLS